VILSVRGAIAATRVTRHYGMYTIYCMLIFNYRCLIYNSWDGACLQVVAPHAKSSKMTSMFLKEEKICYEMVHTLHLGIADGQKFRWKVRIYADEKARFPFERSAWEKFSPFLDNNVAVFKYCFACLPLNVLYHNHPLFILKQKCCLLFSLHCITSSEVIKFAVCKRQQTLSL